MPEIEALAENPSYNDIRSQWYSLRKQWQAIARDVEIDAELRARYDAAAQKLEAQEQVHRDAKGQQQVENLQRLQALVQKFETRAAAESLTLKQTDQLMKDVKLAVGTMGPLPTKQDREDLMVRLQAVRTVVDAAHPGAARSGGVEALGQRPGAGRALREDGSARPARRNRSGKSLERNAHAAGAVEAGRRRAAIAGRDAVDALQDRAGAGLRQVQGLLRAAGDRARREPEEEGSAVRCAPNRWPTPPIG